MGVFIGRNSTATSHIRVDSPVDVGHYPSIVFDPESLEYDEMVRRFGSFRDPVGIVPTIAAAYLPDEVPKPCAYCPPQLCPHLQTWRELIHLLWTYWANEINQQNMVKKLEKRCEERRKQQKQIAANGLSLFSILVHYDKA